MDIDLLEALHNGKTLLYPTDTIWGIGCDATNAAAVEKIYAIKKRDHSKSMLILCADESMVLQYISHPNAKALQLLLHSERPTTVIFPLERNHGLAPNLPASDNTIGIRIPKHGFCQELLQAFGKPLVSTSANFSGEPSPACYGDISEELKHRIDFLVPDLPQYESHNSQGSTILKVTPENEILVLRP